MIGESGLSSLRRAAVSLFTACIAMGPVAFAKAPQEAADFYSFGQRDGIWWFIAPGNRPFFSLGVTCVDLGGKPTDGAEHVEYVYSDFYDSPESWAADTVQRLQSWDFNTIGGWSSEHVNGKGMPDTPVLHIGASTGLHWGDLFDEAMARAVYDLVENMAAPRSQDPNLLGWFSDNELGWYAETSFLTYLKAAPESATRQRLIAMLRERYGADAEALGKDFVLRGATSFEDLARGGMLHLKPGGGGREAVHAFAEIVATRYYQLMHDAIRKFDPNHLILGDRYNGYYPWAVARAAAPFVDVISTNASFADTKDGAMLPFFVQTLHRLTGKPVVVSEYYSAAMENQSGNRNSSTNAFIKVQTQTERTLVFERSLHEMLASPHIVGAHWFQYFDEPPAGRGDGEDFNFGLVDIHNEPYPMLIEAMTRLNAEATTLHRNARLSEDANTIAVPHGPNNPFVGLFAWNKTEGYVPYASELSFGDLLVCRDSEYLYLALRADDYMDAAIYAGGVVPREDAMRWSVSFEEGAPAFAVRFGARLAAECDDAAVHLRHHDGGIRQVVIASVPLASLPRREDGTVTLQCEATGYARYMQTRWSSKLDLAFP